MPTDKTMRCPRCRSLLAKDECSINPRQGYIVCPRCWREGYDIIPDTLGAPVTCGRCGGSGGGDDPALVCRKCNGSGRVACT